MRINDPVGTPICPRLLPLRLLCTLVFLLFMGTVAYAAGYQPDLMVKLASEGDASYLGEGVYESTAVTQTRSQPAFPGTAAAFRVLLKNAGDAPDTFVIRGTGSDNILSVRYQDEGGVDRSAVLSAETGYITAALAPGASVSFLVQVAPSLFPLGASYRVTVSASSVSASALGLPKTDQLKTETVACSQGAAVTVTVPDDRSGFPGSVVSYPYTVSNVGSTANSFALSAAGSGGWPSSIYADDGAGGGIAADGVRQSGELRLISSTGQLAPGEASRFFVAVTIPESSRDRARDDTRLTVAGTGAAGADQVTTSAIAAVITLTDNVRNVTRGGPFAATASAVPGDTLEYRMTITNSGSVAATGVGIDTPLPANSMPVPESLWVGTSPGGDGTPCAPALCGWVRASNGNIMARLGQGATDSAGGDLLPGKTLYVYYRVQVE